MAEGATFIEVDLAACAGCGSGLGPFKSAPDGKEQIICSTCGMRGPYATRVKTAEYLWNRLPRGHK